MGEIETDHGDEQRQAAGDAEEQELQGCIGPVGVAPAADDQEGRQQLQLPEQVEEKEIGGQKEAEHRGLHQQQGGVEQPDLGIDGAPGDQHAEKAEQGGEQDQQHADPVRLQTVMDAELIDPGRAFTEPGKACRAAAGAERPGWRRRAAGCRR